MPLYEVTLQSSTHAAATLVQADAVRVDHGDLIFTRHGLASHLIAAGRWAACQEQEPTDK